MVMAPSHGRKRREWKSHAIARNEGVVAAARGFLEPNSSLLRARSFSVLPRRRTSSVGGGDGDERNEKLHEEATLPPSTQPDACFGGRMVDDGTAAVKTIAGRTATRRTTNARQTTRAKAQRPPRRAGERFRNDGGDGGDAALVRKAPPPTPPAGGPRPERRRRRDEDGSRRPSPPAADSSAVRGGARRGGGPGARAAAASPGRAMARAGASSEAISAAMTGVVMSKMPAAATTGMGVLGMAGIGDGEGRIWNGTVVLLRCIL